MLRRTDLTRNERVVLCGALDRELAYQRARLRRAREEGKLNTANDAHWRAHVAQELKGHLLP